MGNQSGGNTASASTMRLVSACPKVLRTTVARTQTDNLAADSHNYSDGSMPSGSVMRGG